MTTEAYIRDDRFEVIGVGVKVVVQPYERLEGIYIFRSKDDAIVTKSLAPGEPQKSLSTVKESEC